MTNSPNRAYIEQITREGARCIADARNLRLNFPSWRHPLARLRAARKYYQLLAQAQRNTDEANRLRVRNR